MAKHRKPASRAALRKASQEKKPGGGLALGGARLMAEGLNPEGSEFLVRDIVAYNATKIFHAPVSWPDESDDSWVRMQGDAPEYSATLTGKLKDYLESGSKLGQFAKDPGLRETVEDIEKRVGNQVNLSGSGGARPDHRMHDGPRGMLAGTRWGKRWSRDLQDRRRRVADVQRTSRAGHRIAGGNADNDEGVLTHSNCMREVCATSRIRGSQLILSTAEMNVAYGGFRSTKPITRWMVAEWASQLEENAEWLRRASVDPAVNELLAAIRLDKARDEEHFRLWYLRLWQALVDVGLHCELQAVKDHLEGLKTQQRWKNLTEHRVAIAHWWTERVDYEKVADLHRLAVEVADYILTVSRATPGSRP